MNKNILIICLFFPPSPSIGGRRSAKFAKYLAKKGRSIHVIHSENIFPNTSPWLKDVTHQNIVKHELPFKYPKEFVLPVITLWQKVKYRMILSFFNTFFPNRNKFDYTFFWENQLLKKASELIKKHHIKNVLVSGPPFYYALYTTKLKEQFPDLNIIVDFRDPWIDSPYYGMSSLGMKQKDFEIKALNKVYNKANYFTAPNPFLLKSQKEYIYPDNISGAKMVELPHGYDMDEVAPFINKSITGAKDNKVKLVYGGQLYTGTEDTLIAFSQALTNLKKTSFDLYSKLEIVFYTPQGYCAKYFADHNLIVRFEKPIGNDIMSKIAEATFCMIFLAHHNKDYRTTKFLEYSVLRRPFLVMGDKGYVAEFVKNSNLGIAFDKESLLTDFNLFIKNQEEFLNKTFNSSFDISAYEYGSITDILDDLLI